MFDQSANGDTREAKAFATVTDAFASGDDVELLRR